MANLQLTLSILKPHVVRNPIAIEQIVRIIQKNDLEIVQRAKVRMTKSLAARFYAEHQGKFFYNRLETSMCSGPIDVMILGGDSAITKWRSLLGPTKVFKAVYTHPSSIRGLFGLTDTRNACHGSDSMDSAKREIGIFFDDFDVDRWLIEHQTNSNYNNDNNNSKNNSSVQRS